MAKEWDRDTNILTEEEISAERKREWDERIAEDHQRRESNDRENYIRPPGMPREEIEELFPYHVNRYRNANNRHEGGANLFYSHDVFMHRWPNKLWYVCHNCGHIGWKVGRSHQLFKCCCNSRNIALIRSSHISKILREHPEYSTNMQEVYNERRERLRRQRAERSAARRNA